MPELAGDHGCLVKSRAKVAEPSQQHQEQVKTGLCTPLGPWHVAPRVEAAAEQLCSGRSEREPMDSDVPLVSAPLLWQSAAHTLSPHSAFSAALPLLKSPSSTHVLHTTAPTPPQPPLTLFHTGSLVHTRAGCSSQHPQHLYHHDNKYWMKLISR